MVGTRYRLWHAPSSEEPGWVLSIHREHEIEEVAVGAPTADPSHVPDDVWQEIERLVGPLCLPPGRPPWELIDVYEAEGA